MAVVLCDLSEGKGLLGDQRGEVGEGGRLVSKSEAAKGIREREREGEREKMGTRRKRDIVLKGISEKDVDEGV